MKKRQRKRLAILLETERLNVLLGKHKKASERNIELQKMWTLFRLGDIDGYKKIACQDNSLKVDAYFFKNLQEGEEVGVWTI